MSIEHTKATYPGAIPAKILKQFYCSDSHQNYQQMYY